MSIFKKKYVGKIGWVNDKVLGIRSNNKTEPKEESGHYVYIRNVDFKTKTCDVNTITSLEAKNLETKKMEFTQNKISQVKKGNTYPIPIYDANFGRWSGITKKPIKNIPISKIENLGEKNIKKRHKFFVGKFFK